jgi:hypothetical protein
MWNCEKYFNIEKRSAKYILSHPEAALAYLTSKKKDKRMRRL